MNRLIYIVSILMLLFNSNQVSGQCDTASIYANTTSNAVCFDTTFSKVRNCYSNNYPDHDDSYNSGFTVTASEEMYSMCLYPDTAANFTPLYEETETAFGCNYTYQFGVSINGIGYTPNSNEHFDIIDPDTGTETGESNIEWHKEARYMFNGAFGNNGGHLNQFGSYHYHDVPVDYFTDSLGITGVSHSSIVGYAADGFPIYYKYVYADPDNTSSSIVGLSSGYSLKSGTRPGDGYSAPDGTYNGLYYEDYEYTSTDLDSCNGRWGKTPEFPDGTYYYVLTDNYPYIPRCFKGTVLDNTFRSLANCPESTASTDCSDGPIEGCMDPFSCNYNAAAEIDDGSCDYNYGYDSLTINSGGTYTSPSGAMINEDGTYLDTVVYAGSCDSIYTIFLTVEGAVSARKITHPSSSISSDGEILFGPPSGTPSYSFSVDSGLTYSSSMPPKFTGLAVGTYWTVIKDGNGNEIYEAVTLSSSLPIELLTFTGESITNGVRLNWVTAFEINSSHFEIERSADGINFNYLGNVKGQLNSDQLNTYSFTDFGFTTNQKYYRLKMIDVDGSYEYSKTIVIEDNSALNDDVINIFPNPGSTQINISQGQGRAVFYNQYGQIILDTQLTENVQLDIAGWNQGKYFIRFFLTDGRIKTSSFLKIKD